MPGRTLDALVQEKLGITEMVILRLQWQIEDLQSQNADLQAQIATLQAPPVTDGPKDQTP